MVPTELTARGIGPTWDLIYTLDNLISFAIWLYGFYPYNSGFSYTQVLPKNHGLAEIGNHIA
jgi:hypothetical protein